MGSKWCGGTESYPVKGFILERNKWRKFLLSIAYLAPNDENGKQNRFKIT
jgi:hypothetical protein